MSKVDDELTRRLRRAERPVDGDDLFEGLERRRSHRERVRRVQAGMLAFAVLAATAGGFVFLRHAFDADKRNVGDEQTPVVANGEIVFSDRGKDGYIHLYAVQPDGSSRRQITDFGTNDTDAAVSPDGRTIAFVHQLEDVSPAIATIPIQGGTVTWQSPEGLSAADPSWSPDGTRIAFVAQTSGWSALHVMRVNNAEAQPLTSRLDVHTVEPTWSPDGTRIAFALRGRAGPWGLATIRPNGTGLEPLAIPVSDGDAPAWSPDGSSIAFMRPYQGKDAIWTMPATGGEAQLVAYAPELEHDLAWAPDATALLVSDGEWIYRVDPSPAGDPLGNLVQLVKGTSPAWQPLPAGSLLSPPPTLEPTVSPSPAPTGRDIGLGFPLCNIERLSGIDWYGDGMLGAAWTGARTTDDGRCPSEGDGEYVVAADLDGDGIAEPGGMGFLRFCLLCRPFAATDLSGDGVMELVVLEEASSTPSYSLYQVSVPTSERSPGIYSLFVAPPGYPAGGFPGDEPIRFLAGGDEGYSAAIGCEGYPAAPVLVVAWSNYAVEVDTTEDVYVTRLRLGPDGVFHVIGREHLRQPVGDPLPIDPPRKACGVDFDPLA
jgi:hypothetical protein